MIFNSPVFLFLFLPVVLLLHFIMPKRGRNLLLFAASLFFYAWGDAHSLYVLLFSIALNYALAIRLERSLPARSGKLILALALCANLALLLYYKYLKFAAFNLDALGLVDLRHFEFSGWHLPLGISFFTFSAIAYQIDIYREKTRAERSLIGFGLYLSHFAKVVAGPIVRYSDVSDELKTGKTTLEDFACGVRKFIVGLAKKVLIANPAAMFADEAFKGAGSLGLPTAWLGIVCYTIQIYFDFSGYSDMAIGLGRMFGFTFLENFNYPYISQSIQEFWRRWHISLSTWFRDYLYIPLGGNRGSEMKTYFNLVVVFLLCGLWHGASWNFIIWGTYHGTFLALERAWLGRALSRLWVPLRHIYAVLVIMIGWVFFRADNISQAILYLGDMFSFSLGSFDYYHMSFVNRQLLLVLALGAIGSTPVLTISVRLRDRIEARNRGLLLSFYDLYCSYATLALMIFLFIVSAMQLAITTYTPFIYTRF